MKVDSLGDRRVALWVDRKDVRLVVATADLTVVSKGGYWVDLSADMMVA